MRSFVGVSTIEISLWCLARLLDETVQHDHPSSTIDIEQDSDDAIAVEFRADFVEPVAHRAARRHADRSAEFDRLQILADASSILSIHRPQPFAHWLAAGRRPEEDGGYPLH